MCAALHACLSFYDDVYELENLNEFWLGIAIRNESLWLCSEATYEECGVMQCRK
jgi:hypothetical protein